METSSDRPPAMQPLAAGAWRWEQSEGLTGVAALGSAWRELAERTQALPFADALWAACFWKAFGGSRQKLAVHALYRGERLAAVLPLVAGRLPLPSWSSLFNAHVPMWDCAIDLTLPGVAGELLERLLGSASLIDLRRLSSGGAFFSALQEAALERGLPVAVHSDGTEAMIELCAPWESCCQTLPESVRRHLQKLRQLERQGPVEFREMCDAAGLDALLEECFALEALGWKGTGGSPIREQPDTLTFYTELAQGAARSGRLALYTLRLCGRLIAFEFCLKGAERVDALKISYAADLAQQSPGNVLRTLVLRSEVEKGQIRIHHLGLSSPWKIRWATRQEPLCRLRIYGGGLLARAAHGAGPRLRQRLSESPRLRAAVHASSRLAGRALAGVSLLSLLFGRSDEPR